MSKKRWRAPSAKPGELKAQYGKLPHDTPDLCYAWGEGCSSADSHLLHNVIATDRAYWDLEKAQRRDSYPISHDPSLVKELERRGYDITTLKFSIQKKVVK